jgi:Domain of unknown function (DUF5010)
MWYRWHDNKAFGNANFFDKLHENASKLLNWLKEQFVSRYGVEPAFLVQENWLQNDQTITTEHATGAFQWISLPDKISGKTTYDGHTVTVAAPSFRDLCSAPGCVEQCREVIRKNGHLLEKILDDATQDSELIMLEGWTNMIESARILPQQQLGLSDAIHQYGTQVR